MSKAESVLWDTPGPFPFQRIEAFWWPRGGDVNVYAIDDNGKVHDVAYDLHADDARRMAKGLEGGVAAAERPDEKKPEKADS